MSTVSARTPVQPFASVAVTTKAKLPSAVGVPVTLPAPLIERPVGSAPDVTAYEYGDVPPDADVDWL